MKLEKIEKNLGHETVLSMQGMSHEDLKRIIVEANQAMKEASDELEANPKFQELKDSLASLSSSKKEVNKRQTAKIAYALFLLESFEAKQYEGN